MTEAPDADDGATDDDDDVDDDHDEDEDNEENEPPNMAKDKSTKGASKSAPTKRGNAKTTGDEPISVNTPPPKRQKDAATKRAKTYFSTTCKKGYTVNPWSQGSKQYIDVVFHNGGVPSPREEPSITLGEGGKQLLVEWKLPEKLFTAMQASAQRIPVDSARYNGYCNTQDQMKAVGVHPIEHCYRSVPQVVPLEQECTGVPENVRYNVPTNEHVEWRDGGRMGNHRQFNSMYVSTLQVAKDRHQLTSGPKTVGHADFGDVEPVRSLYGGGGGFGGGGGRESTRQYYGGPPHNDVSGSSSGSNSYDDE